MARLRHPAMSAQRSLTGGKRTLLGHRQIDAFDPKRKSDQELAPIYYSPPYLKVLG